MFTAHMTNGPDKKPKPGDLTVLTRIPPGMMNDLPAEDQKAISEIVGKPILLREYDEVGRAELEFSDSDGTVHFICVAPEFIREAAEIEVPIVGGPRTTYMDVLVAALNEECITARIVTIETFEPENRPVWACTPGEEVYVVVPRDKREAALELTRWVSRVGLNCEAILMPRVHACQNCGAPHAMEPGPRLYDSV
jgi:hypothetical protein